MLDMEKGAIQLDGWEGSKILAIYILPHEEIVFWTEIMVTSIKTVYNLEKDYCSIIPVVWGQFICISDQPDREILWEFVFILKHQQTLSFGAVPFLPEAFWSPRWDHILLVDVQSQALTQVIELCSVGCGSSHSVSSRTGTTPAGSSQYSPHRASLSGWKDQAYGGLRELGVAEGAARCCLGTDLVINSH